MEYVNLLKSIFNPMPFILRSMALCFFGFSMFLVALIPNSDMTYTVNGNIMSFTDFMNTKAPLAFLAAGVIFPICGFSIVKRMKWGRYVMFIGYVIPGIVLEIFSITQLEDLYSLIPGILFSILVYWYLFIKKTVQNYYNNHTENLQ